ncbi:aromatic amino acid transaminase (plasmid) [Deinococcus taeanensis]|uniref:amino acid aminotransferase n=1 Tax=Deinococcus taeanensis TaxID=2737050 RepID=UPI001CDD1A43|nr:aromatic amino acid transaminase [Deinococcus taeanensis]UBV45293.1 aromatic amino acid transaminase [Deinococcus taeanensis]
MFKGLAPVAQDPLWALTAAYAADPRPDKVDLGLGVYRTAEGVTPVLMAVQRAEAQLAAAAPSKTYRPLSGNGAFNAGITRLLLGDLQETRPHTVTLQTVGGTGALRMLAELVAEARPEATVWLSDPGYQNHHPLMQAAGLSIAEYPWTERNGVTSLPPLLAALEQARPGDVLLIQGCCHNPTGIDLDLTGWQALADVCRRRGLTPLVDMAYQGLGRGLSEDAEGLRLLAGQLDTVLVAASCSKNMGLYCERTGAALVVVSSRLEEQAVRSVLENTGRRTYSMPPEHGAAIAAELMAAPDAWQRELHLMRARISTVRERLTAALQAAGAPEDLQRIRRHQGMFSLLPLTPQGMARLRDEFGIYGTPEGRINIAGIADHRIEALAHALTTVHAQARRGHPVGADRS